MVDSKPIHATRPRADIDVPHARGDLSAASHWRWLVPLLGVAFVAFLVVNIVLTSPAPDDTHSGASVISYYTAHRTEQHIAGLFSYAAVPVGLFFFGMLRTYLRRSADARPWATIGFVGTAVFAVGGAVSAGAVFALADVPSSLTASSAQALNVVNEDLAFPIILAGLSTVMLGYGIAVLRSRLLPVWLGWAAVVIGVVSLAGPIGFFGFIAAGVWILIVCGVLYGRLAASS